LAQQTTGAQETTGDREVTDALYDADGMRLLRRSTTHKNGKPATTSTFYLGDTEITLTGIKNTPRTVQRGYTTPGGVPVGTEENKAKGAGISWTWLLADQQHNIRLTRDNAGVKRTNYLPSGAPTGNVSLAPGARGYLNKTHDPSGDIRLDHRNYTPTINILTTPDPVLAPYDPQTLNPYAYSRNNPITLSDPTGLCAISDTGPRVCQPGPYGVDYPDQPPAPSLPEYPENYQGLLDYHLAEGGDEMSFGQQYFANHMEGPGATDEETENLQVAKTAYCARFSGDQMCHPASAGEAAMAGSMLFPGTWGVRSVVWSLRAARGALAARAAKPAIGFADDAVASAFQGMRSGGGHATRHLREAGLIENAGSLASQVGKFAELTSPILRSPAKTFDWTIGNTAARAFAGMAGGKQVVVFVAKEGPYQGRVLSAVVPRGNQATVWGLLP
ncbi:MAG: RHS repeat-associated core domain-containing protein, partial [Nocardioides sp.]|uniref:RHS repeat-associated core domain-containing protein n=1 Tax=Nocardioides sp. TaxID=35761 RepID=UPI0032660597